jgi:hypothetical protein
MPGLLHDFTNSDILTHVNNKAGAGTVTAVTDPRRRLPTHGAEPCTDAHWRLPWILSGLSAPLLAYFRRAESARFSDRARPREGECSTP